MEDNRIAKVARDGKPHSIEDRQADHQRGGGIAGCRRRKELPKAGKTDGKPISRRSIMDT